MRESLLAELNSFSLFGQITAHPFICSRQRKSRTPAVLAESGVSGPDGAGVSQSRLRQSYHHLSVPVFPPTSRGNT